MDLEDHPKKHHGHDTHAIPPQAICNIYKKYQKMDDVDIDSDLEVVDFGRGLTKQQDKSIVPVDTISSELVATARDKFMSYWPSFDSVPRDSTPKACTIYEHKDFAGLRILPSLLPPECQFLMLDSILHRDLANPLHKTNIHQDYSIPYPPPNGDSSQPESFFTYPPHSKNQVFTPINPHSNHKALNTTQFLHKKLRWLTLGSQYDWTTRAYPAESPTRFPADISSLVTTLFKNAFKPESGVVLLYSTKDYMPVHRDVSEECQKGLASFTLGCDGLFILSRDKKREDGEAADEDDEEREMETCVLRVRSGDCVWMGGETRWCWHAMPKIMGGTCPKWLEDWPVGVSGEQRKEFEKWKGFMKSKRLNISCRQVWS
ncbi:uncharacterized protein LY89DRAFT_741111 [Mollisia scopiformis]|uniref:mRNA N(6)-methyladenine demethylase n=1 Tax=Mollisia scopiformis TaxID=149040 RepID=A0A132BAH6_MOLSC|nr:uncharacterized protein LY89DRAFT_741111 [Mollisia scopiformis]KUJ09398.1 hypothetical protein LY89DRAFT_741111 [Mollisia scopiformis]